MTSPSPAARRAGFTLTEVLVAAVILLIGFVPVYLFLFSTERGAAETVRSVEALGRAQTLVEEAGMVPYALLEVEGGRRGALEFKNSLPKAEADLISASLEDEKRGYAAYVEVRQGKAGKLVIVGVRDTLTQKGSDGSRDVVLGTLVMP